MAETETPTTGPVTLTQIKALIEEKHSDVLFRMDTFEGTLSAQGEQIEAVAQQVKALGLNGLTPYVKPFFEQYAATLSKRQAWITVRSDLAWKLRWVRWLAAPRNWLKAIFYAFLGGLGLALVDRVFHVSISSLFP